ncbi:MAG: YcbK family protein [Polyangia bacterium]
MRKLAILALLALPTCLLALVAQPAGASTKPATARPATQGGKPRTGAKPAKVAKAKVPKNAPVVLYHVNWRETMPLKLRDAHGRPVKGLQRRFDHLLRCHHTNTQHKMDPRLMRLLYTTGHHWPGRRLEIVSGYRNPTVAKNPHSPHMQGLACDFRVEGVKTAELRDYLRRNFEKVGVGYYPNSSFVHLDVRKDKSAFWIDYSGPGERSIYSATPDQDLKNGRADSYHPTKIDTSWADAPPPPPDPDGRAPAPSENQSDDQ